jgi:hypothetical protein
MKTKFFLIFMLLIALVSCDQIKELAAVKIHTNLKWNFPISVSSTGIVLKSGNTSSYPFTKTGTVSLNDDEDVAKYIDKIQSVAIDSVDASVLGLSSGQVIQTLAVSINGIGTIMTFTNVTSTSVLNPNVSETLKDQIAEKLKTDHTLTAVVNGSANYAPMTFNVQLEIDATIKADSF